MDPYRVWPSEPLAAGQSLPVNVIQHLKMSGSPVWPVQPTSPGPCTEYDSLNSVLFAREGLGITAILSALGLKICCPPPFIFELLSKNKALGALFMVPVTVHSILNSQVDRK